VNRSIHKQVAFEDWVDLSSGVPRGGLTPTPEFPKALQNRAKLNPIVKTKKKNPEFMTPTPQDVWKKCSKILNYGRFAVALR